MLIADHLSPTVWTAAESTARIVSRHGLGRRVDWWRIVQVLLLVVVPCACYWPAMNGEFLWDDELVTTHSPQIRSLDGLWQIWFSTAPLDYYPLTNTSFWLQWRLWGNQPAGYHWVNLALHVAGAFLFWRLLRVLRLPGAWFAALLFAIHPVNVASVAWIAELKNVLSMAFYLASLISFARWRERSDAPGTWGFYLVALACYVLAAFAKASVIILPCVLLLIVWWQDGQLRRRDFTWTLPFFVVSLVFGFLSIWFQHHRGMDAEQLAQTPSLVVRVLTATRAIWFYLGKVVFPYPLAMLYPRWSISARDPWAYLPPLGLVMLLAVAWWATRFWGRGPLTVLGCFILGILPVSGLVHMGFFSHSNVSDHYVHLAAPALFASVAALLVGWYETCARRGRLALIAMTGVAGWFCLGCVQRAGDFGSSENLWSATLEVAPNSFGAHNNLGLALVNHGRQDARRLGLAESHFRRALDLDCPLASAGVNLANVLYLEGRWAESAELYRKALEVAPKATSYNNYGVSLLRAGDLPGAREAMRMAVRLEPAMANAYYNLYRIEQSAHRLPEAFAMLRACLRVDPDNVAALSALVALTLDSPDQPSVSAAEVLAATAERTCELTQYRSARCLVLLSRSLSAAGRQSEAAGIAARAHEATVADALTATAATDDEYWRPVPH